MCVLVYVQCRTYGSCLRLQLFNICAYRYHCTIVLYYLPQYLPLYSTVLSREEDREEPPKLGTVTTKLTRAGSVVLLATWISVYVFYLAENEER